MLDLEHKTFPEGEMILNTFRDLMEAYAAICRLQSKRDPQINSILCANKIDLEKISRRMYYALLMYSGLLVDCEELEDELVAFAEDEKGT